MTRSSRASSFARSSFPPPKRPTAPPIPYGIGGLPRGCRKSGRRSAGPRPAFPKTRAIICCGIRGRGNVRELRNAVERAVILCNDGLVASEHLPTVVASSSRNPLRPAAPARDEPPASSLPAGLKLDTIQRGLLEKALASARNNKSKAARLLGVPRGRFYSLLRRHGLTDARR